jgi:ParB family chromosome partitioning protein
MGIAKNIKLNSLDSLFGNDNPNGITEVIISALKDFHNHPFKIINDEKMADLIESIKEYGVLTPIVVRANGDKYEIISGHRRKYACEQLGITKIPAIIKELDDDEATILMVDSNIQREEILFSERAFAYKLKLDAMKRQGQRTDLTCSQVGNKLESKKSLEILADEVGESKNQIHRYIRLTQLITDLLDMVDTKKLPFNTAVELSYLKENEQELLIDAMTEYEVIPSLKQASRLKSYSKDNKLDENVISAIITEEKETPIKINLTGNNLKKYFPKEYTAKHMEDVIYKLLEDWSKNK